VIVHRVRASRCCVSSATAARSQHSSSSISSAVNTRLNHTVRSLHPPGQPLNRLLLPQMIMSWALLVPKKVAGASATDWTRGAAGVGRQGHPRSATTFAAGKLAGRTFLSPTLFCLLRLTTTFQHPFSGVGSSSVMGDTDADGSRSTLILMQGVVGGGNLCTEQSMGVTDCRSHTTTHQNSTSPHALSHHPPPNEIMSASQQ
jgi:hypothetical protein